jgi:murein DD-endopeptidase MepM/ murein hydrolase activator NlpD
MDSHFLETPEITSPSTTPTQIVATKTPDHPVASTQASFQMCSPLAWETIAELPEIISDPYKPPSLNRAEERHHGVDFSHYSRKEVTTIEGEPVQAVLTGVVASVIVDRLPYGNMVMIETAAYSLSQEMTQALGLDSEHSLYILYAHFGQSPLVSLGENVGCGQVLGEVGATGYNNVNPHLHLETRVGPAGVTFPSMAFYTTTASLEEMENYIRWRTGGEFTHFDPMSLFQRYLDGLDSAIP